MRGFQNHTEVSVPNRKGSAIGRRSKCRDGIENRPGRQVLRGRRFEQDDVSLGIAYDLLGGYQDFKQGY